VRNIKLDIDFTIQTETVTVSHKRNESRSFLFR